MKVFSFGGGVQSNAALVLAKQRKIDYSLFVFANTGDDSEDPETLEYVRNVSMPYAQKHGIELVEVQKKGDTLLQAMCSDRRSVLIPVRLGDSLAPSYRTCTVDWKIKVVDDYCKHRGFDRIVVGLGITIDEIERATTSEWGSAHNGLPKQKVHPLIDLRLSRHQCASIIQSEGLPLPPKSACWFCPFKSNGDWVRMKQNHPELFYQACEVEKKLESKGLSSRVRLHRSGNRLSVAVGDQLEFPGIDDNCESGYCMV